MTNNTTPGAEILNYPDFRRNDGVVLRRRDAEAWRRENQGAWMPLTRWLLVGLKLTQGAELEVRCADETVLYLSHWTEDEVSIRCGPVNMEISREEIIRQNTETYIPGLAFFKHGDIRNHRARRVWTPGWLNVATMLPVGQEMDAYLEREAECRMDDDACAERLDELEGPVQILNLTYSASQVLQEVDPVAWSEYVQEEREHWVEEVSEDEEELARILEGEFVYLSPEDVERLNNAREGVRGCF